MEGLFRKRWEGQLAELKRFKVDHGDLEVPKTHPTLGNWVRTQQKHFSQQEHFSLHEQGMPSALTKKRFNKLKDIGFGNRGHSKDADNNYEKFKHGNNAIQENDHCNIKRTPVKQRKDRVSADVKQEGCTSEDDDHWSNVPTPPKSEKEHSEKEDDPLNDAEVLRNDGKVSNLKGRHIPTSQKSEKESTEEVDDQVADAEVSRKDNKVAKLKGRCDICEKRDGYLGHNLQQCKKCHVLVHELCYGMPETDCKDSDFVCHACKAVGCKIEFNVPSKIGGCGEKMGEKREKMKQKELPQIASSALMTKVSMPCILFDTHGPEGRQLCLSVPGRGVNARKKLAWVHTLCASVICANPGTAGSVYGCDKDGNWHGDFEDTYDEGECFDEGNDNRKEKEKKSKSTNYEDSEGSDESCTKDEGLRCFAIAADEEYEHIIREHRGLRCFICGKKDKILKFPIQCQAGDEEEYGEWKDRHHRDTEPCTMAMHVGCARWGCVEPEGAHLEMINGKRCKLCYFTPGRYSRGDNNETVAHCYCAHHARDIIENNPNRKKKTIDAARISPAIRAKTNGKRTSVSESNRVPVTRRRENSTEHVQSSFNKSMNSIVSRGGNKKVPPKRISPGDIFGVSPKKQKVHFTEEDAMMYSVKGKSAIALARSAHRNLNPSAPTTDRKPN
eukprot:CAMPEP_0181094990 /NCGR_PEP_ID=MMETSP1071-20121207/10287_1 /TAXON_ID=35127 /ORGANISM="Thalassiosira sp., Strain NH16" /LENGTH=669 /DNA_ID=CAMNT_0023177355 /DNA_START=1 /DNA_END=2011 /DNA_ORIENTATION=+